VLFKQGAKSELVEKANATDAEDKAPGDVIPNAHPEKKEMEAAVKGAPRMTDIFSWQNIEYTVPITGEADRKLLDRVSGYVAPGKLTALMGASGGMSCLILSRAYD
jgi:ATP-binding cassette subfamily G (WHITE) protein 2 (SNQ2)